MIKTPILIVAYYWPPFSGVATHRWLHMANYLSELNYDVHVLVPENPNYTNTDENLEKLIFPEVTVIKEKIREVRNLLSRSKKFDNKSKMDDIFFKDNKSTTWKEKFLLWIRANFFIPDARISWYFQVRSKVVQYIEKKNIHLIITSGTPHSLHFIGEYAKKKKSIPWIADFRDPWTTMEYHDKMPMTSRTKRKHKWMEKQVLSSADATVTVSPQWAQEFTEIGSKNSLVVLNGFDENTFKGLDFPVDKEFVICHTGTIRADRNPESLWEAVKELNEEGKSISVHLYGNVAIQIQEDIKRRGLNQFVKIYNSVDHKKILEIMQRSSVLLVLVNQDKHNSLGRIPAKIFEYIRSERPILLLGNPEGDAAKIINEDKLGHVVSENDSRKLTEVIRNLMDDFKSGNEWKSKIDYSKYSRETMAKEYSTIIESILKK